MEQREFLQLVFLESRKQRPTHDTIKVKKLYRGNKTLFISNGRAPAQARIKLKSKQQSVTFQYINQTDEYWEVRVSPQTIKSATLVLRDIDWNTDDEDDILEKLENPYLSILEARKLEDKLVEMSALVQSLSLRLLAAENKVAALHDQGITEQNAAKRREEIISSSPPHPSIVPLGGRNSPSLGASLNLPFSLGDPFIFNFVNNLE